MESRKFQAFELPQRKPTGLLVATMSPESVVHGDHPVTNAYVDLRTSEYKKRGYIPENLERDTDKDDERSLHFLVMQGLGRKEALALATARLVYRDEKPLAIEEEFGEDFNGEINQGATELSRFIRKNGMGLRAKKSIVNLIMYSALIDRGTANGGKQCFAIVDDKFANILDGRSVPINRVTEPKKFEKYPLPQVGVEFNLSKLNEKSFTKTLGLKAIEVAYRGEDIKLFNTTFLGASLK